MKKKLPVFIAVTVAYILAVLFILGGNETDSLDRMLIVFLYVFVIWGTSLVMFLDED